MLLYVKRAEKQYPSSGYWWGVNDNQISSLNGRSCQWWLVLLFGDGEGSYLASSQQVNRLIASGAFSLQSSKSEYKVNEAKIQRRWQRNDSFKALVQAIGLSLPPN